MQLVSGQEWDCGGSDSGAEGGGEVLLDANEASKNHFPARPAKQHVPKHRAHSDGAREAMDSADSVAGEAPDGAAVYGIPTRNQPRTQLP